MAAEAPVAPSTSEKAFPIWPILLVGGAAIALFMATLAIKPARR